jgi:DNA-binding CsgD family transcriptional regulator
MRMAHPGDSKVKQSFVARERELGVLRAAWRSARGGSSRVVAIEGESGVGKTALAEAFLAEAGEPVIRVGGTAGDPPVPWGVLTDIFWQLPGVARADFGMELNPQALPTAVRETLAGYLRSCDPLVIFLDDAQWADVQSLAVLMDTARRLRAEPVLLVVAYQAQERSPFPVLAGDGLARSWRTMLDGRQAIRLPLHGLPPEEILQLAVASGRYGLSPRDATRLHQVTGGNPDYLLDLFPLLPSNPTVIDETPLPVPASRAAGILNRFAACGATTRQLLCAAAVLGQRFSVAAIREITGIGEPWLYIYEAIEQALLATVPGSGERELSFPRRVVREAIHWCMTDRERAAWHRRCAGLGGPGALRHRIAAVDGVDEVLAADLRDAAADRMRMRDFGGAAYYLQRAMDCTERGPGRTALLLKATEALLLAGRNSAAMEYIGEIEQAPAGPWRDYVLGYLLTLSGKVGQGTALLRGALDALGRGEPAPEDAPVDLRARIAAQLGVLGVVLLSPERTQADGSAALAAGSPDPAVRGLAWTAKALGMALAGDGAQALTLLADAGEPGSASGIEGLAVRGVLRLWADDLAGAAQDLHAVFRRCVRGEALRTSQAIGFLGEVEYRRGYFREAAHFTGLAVDNATDHDRFWDLPALHALAAYPHAVLADWEQAAYHAAEAEAKAQIIGAPAFLAYAAGARAAIAQARGDAAGLLSAADVLEAAYDSREPGTHLFGPVRADALVQLGDVAEAARSLRRFLRRPAASQRKSARMTAARVAAEIAIARGDYAQAAQDCARARDLAVEIGLPLELARVGLTQARAAYGRGLRGAAERALRSAHQGFTALGATAFIRLAERRAGEWDMRIDDVLAALTGRERQICVLVGKGLTSAAIARQLVIDLKTVESHRRNAYRKLGMRTAAELKELLGQAHPRHLPIA